VTIRPHIPEPHGLLDLWNGKTSVNETSPAAERERSAAAVPTDAISRRRLIALRLGRGSSADHWIRIYRRAMACRFEVTLSGEDARHVSAARDALDEADRLEAALTVFRDSSDLMRVNRRAAHEPVAVDEELFALLDRCRTLHAETEGAFDITSTPLSRCWGFIVREGRLPAADAIDAARAVVGMEHVSLEGVEPLQPQPLRQSQVRQSLMSPGPEPSQDSELSQQQQQHAPAQRTVRFDRSGVELNLGSIGKGYAVQRIGRHLRAQGVRHALVSAASSSILALGGRGYGWCIDLHSRQIARGPLARLFLRNGAVGTSGAGEQFVEIDGTRYGHVLDPRTGWPASAGLLSASVVTRDAATADALATAFFVGGPDLARRYCDTHPDTLALLTPDDGSERPQIVGRYPGALVEDV